MKTVVVVVYRLKQYIFKNKSIFVLFVIGGIINSAVFAYMFGNLVPIISNYQSQDYNYRHYSVFFNATEYPTGGIKILPAERSYVSNSDLRELVDSNLYNGILIAADYDGPELSASVGSSNRIAAYIYGDMELDMISGTSTLTGDNQILVDYWQFKKPGETMELNGNKYTVAGVYSYGFSCIMTKKAYMILNPYTNYISLTSKERYHSGYSGSDQAKIFLEKIFPDGYISTPERYESHDFAESVSGIRMTVLTFIISEIAFIFLLTHMADSLTEENAISLIVGAKPKSISTSVFFEGFFLSIICVITGLMLHVFLYRPLFSKLNINEYVAYDIKMYLFMFVIMLVVIIILMLVMSIKYSRLSPVKLRRLVR